mgnify:CR=1 FL=1
MKSLSTRIFTILLTFLFLLPGCLEDGDLSNNENITFPDFTSTAHDGQVYSLSNYTGSPFIALFSAEWCDTPCHKTMHSINSTLNGPNMFVMSSDPQENPQGITLLDWYDKANAHDDNGDDLGQTLNFPFMKGIDAAESLNIDARPTVFFVDENGIVAERSEGELTNEDEILDCWTKAGGTV